ncbi:Ribonuclease H-like domain [Lasallia pustulata]|uniref:Ribonuclease H-like domain n=1 Tax=Lasallia pustulata TaxID=136370 RepID=A0A1W5CT00_9LECA|nr:Ribonuclease H-like domain [Lasallia pustulata]
MASLNKSNLVSLSAIPVLLSTRKFIQWDRKIRDYLSIKGFSTLLRRQINPSTQRPNEEQSAFDQRTEEWEEKQERAYAAVKSRLGYNGRELVKNKTQALDILVEIKKNFCPSGSAAFQDLVQRFDALTLQGCRSVLDFAEQLQTLYNELAKLGDGCQIPSLFLVNKFMSGLGPDYDVFNTAFFQTCSLISTAADADLGTQAVTAVALDDIIMAANLEEQKQKSQDDTKAFLSSQTNAITAKYAVNPANPKERLQPVPYCNHCNKIGHFDEKCFVLHPEMKKRPSEKFKAKKDKGRKRSAAEESDSPAGMMVFSGDEISETLDLGSFGFMAGQNGNGSLAQLAVLDTGCSQHCSSRKDFFIDLRPYHGKPIRCIGEATLIPEAVGTLTIPVKINGNKVDFRLSNSLFCSGLGVTLISVQQILRMKGQVFFDKDKASIIHPKYTLLAPLQHGLFLLNLWDPPTLAGLAAYAISNPSAVVWHQRLAHLGEQNIEKLKTMSTGIKPVNPGTICHHCLEGKLKECPHQKHFAPGTYYMEFIYTDIGGPFPVTGHEGQRYWVTFLDDYTKDAKVITITTKDKFFMVFKRFLEHNERPENRCHRVHLDNSGEARLMEFRKMCMDRRIKLEITATEQHKQNGAAERLNGNIMEKLHPTLLNAKLPKNIDQKSSKL